MPMVELFGAGANDIPTGGKLLALNAQGRITI